MYQDSEQLAEVAAASATMMIAFGPRQGKRARRIGRGFGYETEIPITKGKRCFSVNGFTLHANRYVGMKARGALEKLLAYGARGAFSNQRLALKSPEDETKDLVYTLKAPWMDGTEAIVLAPGELIEKLVALVPPPYIHLSRYFGIFASHSKWRRRIILRPEVKKGFVATPAGIQRLTWAKLLARVFAIDIERCPTCSAPIHPQGLELVTAPVLVHAILHALGLAGRAPARAPPRLRRELDLDIDQRQTDLDDE